MSLLHKNTRISCVFFFFFNDTATTEIYTLSLHDALPICHVGLSISFTHAYFEAMQEKGLGTPDRKSTRLNSSHLVISYAVFCLKKKKRRNNHALSIPVCLCLTTPVPLIAPLTNRTLMSIA